MSSHHFVKEGQEPALCILDQVSFDAAKGLLEWAPKILVTDNALEAILSWGIKVDVVLVKPHSAVELSVLVEAIQPVEILQYPSGELVVATILEYLLNQGQHSVNIMTANASKHLLPIRSFTDSMKVVLFENHSKWTFHPKNFRKWVPKGTSFHIFATQEEQQVNVSGLFENVRNYVAGMDGVVSFDSQTPFWVVEDKIF